MGIAEGYDEAGVPHGAEVNIRFSANGNRRICTIKLEAGCADYLWNVYLNDPRLTGVAHGKAPTLREAVAAAEEASDGKDS